MRDKLDLYIISYNCMCVSKLKVKKMNGILPTFCVSLKFSIVRLEKLMSSWHKFYSFTFSYLLFSIHLVHPSNEDHCTATIQDCLEN